MLLLSGNANFCSWRGELAPMVEFCQAIFGNLVGDDYSRNKSQDKNIWWVGREGRLIWWNRHKWTAALGFCLAPWFLLNILKQIYIYIIFFGNTDGGIQLFWPPGMRPASGRLWTQSENVGNEIEDMRIADIRNTRICHWNFIRLLYFHSDPGFEICISQARGRF